MAVAGRCNLPGKVPKWRRRGILAGLVTGGLGRGLIYGVVDQFLLSDYEDDFLNENTASLFAFIVRAAICGTVLFGFCARSTQRDRGRRVAAHGDPLLSHRTASASRMRDVCGSRVDGSI